MSGQGNRLLTCFLVGWGGCAQAIERAAGGLVRSNSLIILDGADPDEDEEIDEVHAQVRQEYRPQGTWCEHARVLRSTPKASPHLWAHEAGRRRVSPAPKQAAAK